jgi:hypothetical protein
VLYDAFYYITGMQLLLVEKAERTTKLPQSTGSSEKKIPQRSNQKSSSGTLMVSRLKAK